MAVDKDCLKGRTYTYPPGPATLGNKMARINFEVTHSFRKRYNTTIPHGARGEVLRALVEMTLDLVDKFGEGVLTLVVERSLHPSIGAKNETRRHTEVDQPNGDK
jgi:hypothetical protein